MTCLPIYHSVFPFSMHLSQQSVEEIIFHIGCTRLSSLPLNTLDDTSKYNDPYIFMYNNLGRRKANSLARRNGASKQ